MNLETIKLVLDTSHITQDEKEKLILTCIAKDKNSFNLLLRMIKVQQEMKDDTIKEMNNLLSISATCIKETEDKSELAKMSNVLGKIEEFYQSNEFVQPTFKLCWTREEIINEILELSGDEFETKRDMIVLAKESTEQLRKRLKCLQSDSQ